MKRMSIIIMIFAFVPVVPSPLSAQQPGKIQALAGEVYLRSAGRWTRLDRPQQIYSTDKLYTKQGRTDLMLEGGGVVRLDAWTNITLQGATADNGSPTLRVVTGNMWFDLRNRKSDLVIQTPEAIARSNNSSGQVMTETRSGTRIGFQNEGKSQVTGQYEKITSTNQPPMQTPVEARPTTGDMFIHNAINDAIRAQQDTVHLLNWDRAERLRSRKTLYQELSGGAFATSDTAAGGIMKAASARSDAAYGIARSHIAGLQVQLTEEDLMGNRDNAQKIQGLLEEAERDIEVISSDQKEIRRIQSESRLGNSAEGFLIASFAAIIADRSMAKAEIIHINSLRGLSAEQTDTMMTALLNEASRYSDSMQQLLLNMKKIEGGLAGGGRDTPLQIQLAATTSKNSADILVDCLSGLASQARGVVSGAGAEGGATSCRFASTALMASDKAVTALDSGETAALVDALRITEEAIKNSRIDVRDIAGGGSEIPDMDEIRILDQLDIPGVGGAGEEGTGELAREGGFEEPLISPHDLGTASPSN